MSAPTHSPWGTCSSAELAALLGFKDPRRVEQLANEGHVVRQGRGKYDVAASVQAYVAHLKAMGTERERKKDGDPREDARTLKAQAEAAHASLDLQERLGELVTLDYLEETLAQLITPVVSALDNLPSLALRLTGQNTGAAQEILEEWVNQTKALLQGAADDTPDATEDDGAAAGA